MLISGSRRPRRDASTLAAIIATSVLLSLAPAAAVAQPTAPDVPTTRQVTPPDPDRNPNAEPPGTPTPPAQAKVTPPDPKQQPEPAPTKNSPGGRPGPSLATFDRSGNDPGAAAANEARRTGKRVEVGARRTETTTVYAEPDGTFTLQAAPAPVRVRQGNNWADIDLGLTERNGRLQPKVSATDVSLSAGGDTTMATLRSGPASFTQGWNEVLPAPTVQGNTATYRLGAGLDLVVAATRLGFTQKLLLHQRPAGNPTYRFPIKLAGLKLYQTPTGELELRNPAGKVLAQAPRPMLWGAASDPETDEPLRSAPLDVQIIDTAGGQELRLTAPAGFLNDPGLTFPVTLDPSPNLTAQGDTWVQTSIANTSQWGSTELRAGTYDGGATVARSLLTFDTSPVNGQTINTATLGLWNWHSYSCSAREVRAYPLTSPFGSGTVWSNQPDVYGTPYGSGTFALGYSSSCNDGWGTLDMKAVVNRWATGSYANHGVSLRGASETDTFGWKKFTSGNAAGSLPYLNVNYTATATVPSAPQNVSATAGNASATANWSTPASDGGSPVQGYYVLLFDKLGNGTVVTVAASARSYTFSGLVNGDPYGFEIYAYNAVGNSPAGTSGVVYPATTPQPPTSINANRDGSQTATVTWSAPTNNGGAAIDFYYVNRFRKDGSYDGYATTTTTSITMGGLTNGGEYYFEVYAHNRVGYSSPAPWAGPLLIAGPPQPPTNVRATAGEASAQVSWTAPGDTGGMTIDYYWADAYTAANNVKVKGQTVTGTSTTFTGLTPGTSYYFVVYSHTPHDSYGYSNPSANSNTIVPIAPDTTGPAAPTVQSSSHPYDPASGPQWYPRGDIALTWSATDPSGVAGYSYLLDQAPSTDPGTPASPSTQTSAVYNDRASGKYWFHVRAKDNAGNWGAPTHFPIQVDVTAPTAPAAPAGDANAGADRARFLTRYDRTIDVRWEGGGSDTHSGSAGFSYTFDRNVAGVPDATVEADAADRAVTSTALTDGAWYLHVAAVDKAGNRSNVHTVGPFLIGEATLADALLPSTAAGSDELGLEQFAPYDSQPLGIGTAYTQLRTGNLVTQQDLFTVPGQGLNTVARLTHNSQARGRDSGVGRGWNLSVTDLEGGVDGPLEDLTDASVTDIDINRDLTLAAVTDTGAIRQDLADNAAGVTGKLLEFVDGDGTTHRFTRQGQPGGRWVSPPGVDLKVREYLDGTGRPVRYELTRPDGVSYIATQQTLDRLEASVPVWRVIEVRDRSGNVLTYRHENFGPAGINRTRLVEIGHNRFGTAAPIARFSYQPFDATVGATNDNAGVLRSVTTLPGQPGERRIDLTITDGSFITGAGHDLVAITEAAHSTDSNGRRTTRYAYNPDATIASVTDPRGNSTGLAYIAGRPAGSSSTSPTVPMLRTLTDRVQAVTTYTYSPLGTVGATETTVQRPGGAGEGTHLTRYEISERRAVSDSGDDRLAGGNVTKVTDAGTTAADGSSIPVVTSHAWHANKLITTTDGAGAVTEFRYNDLGLLTDITQPAPNSSGAAALTGASTPTGQVRNTLTYTYPAGFSYDGCTDPADSGAAVSTAGSCALVAELDRVVTAGNINGQTRVADFDYDTAGRLTRVIERADTGAAAGDQPRTSDRTTIFGYYDRGGLKSIDGPRTDVADITRYGDTNDGAYGGYHRSGQPLTLTDAAGKSKAFGYSPYGMITSTTDRDGRTTTSSYDQRDNLLEATVPGGATTSYSYDANDNKTAELQPVRTRNGASYRPTTGHSFDAMDRLWRVEAPGADESVAAPVKTVTTTTYNADGSQRSVDGPLPGAGDTTTYSYYPNRLLKEERSPAADPAAPAVTSFFYDAAGRQTRTVLPVADAAGNRPVEQVSYTPAGDVQTRAATATRGTSGAAGNLDKAVDVAFNAHGEPVVTLGPLDDADRRSRQETSYDAFGQPTQNRRFVLNTDGTSRTLLSETGYDLAGNTTRVTQATGDGAQLESLYSFDALNRLVEQTKDPVNPNHEVRYSYNGEGQQIQRADVTAGGAPLRTADTAYNDDNTKRSEIITSYDAATPADQRVLATCNTRPDGTSGYDIDGNLLTSRTVRGPPRADGCALTDGAVPLREQTMAYDDRDWLTSSTMSVRSPGSGAMISRTQRMTYYANGSKASLTHDDGTSTYPVSYAITDAGWESTVTDWRSRSSELSYLPSGNITRQILGRGGEQPGGVATADSTYQLDGTLASLSWTAAGTTVRAHTDIRYDRRGLRVSEQVSLRQPGKTSNDTGAARYAYDLLDRLTSYTSPHPYDTSETRRPTTGYTLDDGGNITREIATVTNPDGSSPRTLLDITNRYTNGRLDSRTSKQTVADLSSPLDLITTDETFTYNELGEETRRNATDKYAGADLAVPIADTTSTTDTRYDAAGHPGRVDNLATKPVGTPQTDLDKANADVEYDYDTADRVISRRETKAGVTSTTLYFYAGTSGSMIEETDAAGKTKTRYLLDGEGESLAQQTYTVNTDGTSSGTGEKWTWLLNDALGNTATVIEDTGKVVEQKAFDPFGKPENGGTNKSSDTDAPTTTLGFQSARTDEATGRVMLGQRQYDPSTARFTTPDTYVAGMLDLQLGTDALTGNRYLFAGANPLAFYEDGHGFFGRLKKIAKASVPALAYVPIVSTAIDVASAATGRDFYNGGRKLSGGERLAMLGGAALGVFPGVGAAAKVGLAVAKGVNKARNSRKVLNAATACMIGNSFLPGTPVLLADGSSQPIEKLRVGDMVVAAEPEYQAQGPREVVATLSSAGQKDLITVTTFDGQKFTATTAHLIYVVNEGGWLEAGDLRTGDLLRQASGGVVAVAELIGATVSNQTVYNLTVADLHTYFVGTGDDALLVHNQGACGRGENAAAALGRRAHQEFGAWAAKNGLDPAVTIRDARQRIIGRTDATYRGAPVELKSEKSVRRGFRQARKYADQTGSDRYYVYTYRVSRNGQINFRPSGAGYMRRFLR